MRLTARGADGFLMDACAYVTNKKAKHYIGRDQGRDALKVDWREECSRVSPSTRYPWVWCNPPYSRDLIGSFISSALRAVDSGCRVVLLVKHDTSTQWWAEMEMSGRMEFVAPIVGSRLRWVHPETGQPVGGSGTFCSVLVELSPFPVYNGPIRWPLAIDRSAGTVSCGRAGESDVHSIDELSARFAERREGWDT